MSYRVLIGSTETANTNKIVSPDMFYLSYRSFSPSFFPENAPASLVFTDDVPIIAREKIASWTRLFSPKTKIEGTCLPTFSVGNGTLQLSAIPKRSRRTVCQSGGKSCASTANSFFPLPEGLQLLQKLTSPEHAQELDSQTSKSFSQYDFFCVLLHPSVNCSRVKAERILIEAAEAAGKYYANCIPYFSASGFLPLFFYNLNNVSTHGVRLRSQLQKLFAHIPDILFHFGMTHTGLSGLYSSYFEAFETYYVDRLQSSCRSFEEISTPESHVSKAPRLVELERAIRTDLEFRKGRNAIAYVSQWFEECRRQNYNLQNFKCDIILLYSSIKNVIFDMYAFRRKRIKVGMEVYEILNISSIPEIEEWFKIWILYTLNVFEPARSGSSFRINDVLDFINSHLTDNLTLERISSYFFISPPYFSTLFKREMGQTFLSYLTGQKMEKARELLTQNHKVSDVSRILGYEDVKHFRTLYKKHFGHTPSSERHKEET